VRGPTGTGKQFAMTRKRRKAGAVTIGTVTEDDYLRAMRKAAREAEIALHGKPVGKRRMVHRSGKEWRRTRFSPADIPEA